MLVTRRWPELVARLAAAGVSVAEVPTVVVKPLRDPRPLDQALRGLDGYAWIVFSSANAVEALVGRMAALGVGMPETIEIASVGPATTRAILSAWPRARVAAEPRDAFRGASLVRAFAGCDLEGRRVLLPVSDRAFRTVEIGLAALGARVDRIPAYRTVASASRHRLLRELRKGIGAVAFASPSAVEAFRAAVGEAGVQVPAVVIGPTTARAARAAGMTVRATARPSTVEGMVRAIARALRAPGFRATPLTGQL